MASTTEDLILFLEKKLHLYLNSYLWLVTTILDRQLLTLWPKSLHPTACLTLSSLQSIVMCLGIPALP